MIKKNHFITAISIMAVMLSLIACKKESGTAKKIVLPDTPVDTLLLSNGYGVPNEDNINIGSNGTSH